MANKRAKEPTTAINITLPVSAAQNLDKNIPKTNMQQKRKRRKCIQRNKKKIQWNKQKQKHKTKK